MYPRGVEIFLGTETPSSSLVGPYTRTHICSKIASLVTFAYKIIICFCRSLGYGSCLADKPHEKTTIKYHDTLPGEIYSVDQQCQMNFGESSSLCPFMVSLRYLLSVCRFWSLNYSGNSFSKESIYGKLSSSGVCQ